MPTYEDELGEKLQGTLTGKQMEESISAYEAYVETLIEQKQRANWKRMLLLKRLVKEASRKGWATRSTKGFMDIVMAIQWGRLSDTFDDFATYDLAPLAKINERLEKMLENEEQYYENLYWYHSLLLKLNNQKRGK